MKCNFVCLDIDEQDGFGSRSIIFTYMQANITSEFCVESYDSAQRDQ